MNVFLENHLLILKRDNKNVQALMVLTLKIPFTPFSQIKHDNKVPQY